MAKQQDFIRPKIISQHTIDVLKLISETPGGADRDEITAAVPITPAQISTRFNDWENKQGYIKEAKGKSERGLIRYVLTEYGEYVLGCEHAIPRINRKGQGKASRQKELPIAAPQPAAAPAPQMNLSYSAQNITEMVASLIQQNHMLLEALEQTGHQLLKLAAEAKAVNNTDK